MVAWGQPLREAPRQPRRAPLMINHEGPDLIEMVFVALVLAGIAFSFTH